MTIEHSDGPASQAEAAQAETLRLLRAQTQLTEEIRNQFEEHLELQRQILRLLMAERG